MNPDCGRAVGTTTIVPMPTTSVSNNDSGSPLLSLIGGLVVLVAAFLVLRWVAGMIWGLVRFGITMAIIIGVIYVIARLVRGFKAD